MQEYTSCFEILVQGGKLIYDRIRTELTGVEVLLGCWSDCWDM